MNRWANIGQAMAERPAPTRTRPARQLAERILERSSAPLAIRLTPADWRFLAVAYVASRIGFVLISLIGAALVPAVGHDFSLAVRPIGADRPWTDLFSHFDSGWYIGISHAYLTPSSGRPDWLAEWAFFPLYPMALHLVALAVGALSVPLHHDILAGVIVSNATLLGGVVYIYRLALADTSRRVARRTVVYLLLFPGGIFFSMVYPESLFLLSCVAGFYHARRRQWLASGVFAAAALLTRPQGLFLLAPLVVEFGASWWYEGPRTARRLLRGVWLLLPLIALGGYAIYSRAITGYWLAFSVSASAAWGHRPTPPIYPLIRYALAPQLSGFLAYDFQPVNFLLSLVFIALVVVAWRRLPPSYALWLVIAVAFPLSTNGHYFFSFARYVATAFPAFIALAAWTSGERSGGQIAGWSPGSNRSQRALHTTVVAIGTALFVLYAVLAVNNYPAAI